MISKLENSKQLVVNRQDFILKDSFSDVYDKKKVQRNFRLITV